MFIAAMKTVEKSDSVWCVNRQGHKHTCLQPSLIQLSCRQKWDPTVHKWYETANLDDVKKFVLSPLDRTTRFADKVTS